MDLLSAIIVAVVSGILLQIYSTFWNSRSPSFHADSFTLLMLKLAIALLPPKLRKDYYDIWWNHIADQPSAQKRTLEAIDFIRAALNINIVEKYHFLRLMCAYKVLKMRYWLLIHAEYLLDFKQSDLDLFDEADRARVLKELAGTRDDMQIAMKDIEACERIIQDRF